VDFSYGKPSLVTKLSALVILAILFALLVLGFYFDNFLKENYRARTTQRILHSLERFASNLKGLESELQKGIEFVKTEETILASIDLINNYQDKNNYNAILLDEEKKLIALELLSRVKLSFNSDIVLFDKHEEAVAFVSKEPAGYRLHYVSFKDGQRDIYSRLEHESLYNLDSFRSHSRVPLDHKPYYSNEQIRRDSQITYHLDEDGLAVKSHQSLFDPYSHKTSAHIELSKIMDEAYFEALSQEWDISLVLSSDPRYAVHALPMQEISSRDELDILQTEDAFISAMSIATQDGNAHVVVSLDKSMLNKVLDENRKRLFLLLFLVASVVLFLMRIILRNGLATPLDALMVQIRNIEARDYTDFVPVHTGDELQAISTNINQLASTVKAREVSLEQSRRELEYLSNHDVLTELPNRRFFEQRLEQALREGKERKRQVAVLFLDLDQFKQVNDTLGHNIGDELLKKFAVKLRAKVRDIDRIARIGGDEFNIVLEGGNVRLEAERLAKDILSIFKTPIHCDGNAITTSASIGIALFPRDGADSVTLIKHADLAMYKTKDMGRNSFTFFDRQLAERIRERTEKTQALKQAIANGEELLLLYQPKVSAHDHRISGLEALIRWESRSYDRVVGPDEFIPLAEESGLIMAIGEWALRKACSDFVRLRRSGYEIGHVSINLSSIQLNNSDIRATLEDCVAATGIQPRCLELEITESYIATDTAMALKTLRSIRDMGIGLAIDDFGTGYSSMSYLKRLPVTRLKIDKAFVDHLPFNAGNVEIVRFVIGLAKSFDLAVTAEGVESSEQLRFLEAQACDEIQGYVFSRPLSYGDLANYLGHKSASNETVSTGRKRLALVKDDLDD